MRELGSVPVCGGKLQEMTSSLVGFALDHATESYYHKPVSTPSVQYWAAEEAQEGVARCDGTV